MAEKEAELDILSKLREQKRISNKKYYNKKKQEEKQEIKTINKDIECTPKEEIKMDTNQDSINGDEWSDWCYETIKGGFQMVAQTLIQTSITIAIPAILMLLRQQSMTTPLITSSVQASKQQEKDTKQQITSLSLL